MDEEKSPYENIGRAIFLFPFHASNHLLYGCVVVACGYKL